MAPTNLSVKTLQAYADAGYTLFPLIGKIPPKGFSWSKAEYNLIPSPEDFPSGNFGVKLAEDDLVIDIDPRNFPKDRKVMDEFNTAMGFKAVGASFTVRTGSGGAHIYFKKPADFAVRGAVKQYPGIEFKTKGQYVVGLDSIHPDTNAPYTRFALQISDVTNAPQTLLDLITKKEITHEQTKPMEYTDDKQTQDRFLRYLTTAPMAIEGQGGDKTTFSVAAVAHDFGLHPDLALQLMVEHYNPRCEPPWGYNDLKTKVYNAYRYSAEVVGALSAKSTFEEVLVPVTALDIRSNPETGMIHNNLYNCTTVLEVDLPDTLAMNIFSGDIIFLKPAPWHKEGIIVPYWDDSESPQFRYYEGKTRHYEPKKDLIEEALVNIGKKRSFHPIKHDLESYVWDGMPRIKDWLVKFLGAEDNAYTRQVGLKVLVAAIKRLYEPGCKFDYIMVLEGKQGIGKSQVIKVLGGEYYGDIDINLHNKDTYDAMRRFWITETSEMEAVRKHESAAMKAFLSRCIDTYRVPYGKRAQDFKRQSIFIGTINPEVCTDVGWMKDTTGNRRYWPVALPNTQINIDNFRKVRNQLWAEALMHYRKGTPIWLEDIKIEIEATKEQDKRMGTDAWFDRIQEWLVIGYGKDKEIVSASNLYCDCLGGAFAKITVIEQRRLADIMRVLGWEKGVFYSKEVKDRVRGYRRPTTAEDLGI